MLDRVFRGPGDGELPRASFHRASVFLVALAAVHYTRPKRLAPMLTLPLISAFLTVFLLALTVACGPAAQGFGPGARVLIDAHNCYPYHGRWADRINRALATGLPVAIEQDLAWYTDPRTNRSRSLLSHEEKADGTEPDMREYFFERIRPFMERALREGDRSKWPLIVLNLDFRGR